MTKAIVSSAQGALAAGLLLTAGVLAAWLYVSAIDLLGLISFLIRWLHVLAGIAWIGMIWFVNFVQFAALDETDQAGRMVIMNHVAPKVSLTFRRASHVTIATGFLLMVTTGYLFDRWVFSSAVYVPPLKAAMLWGGTICALLMWVFVHFVITPAMRQVMAEGSHPDTRMAAARRIRIFARFNLVLAVPVTFVMVAAAHLY